MSAWSRALTTVSSTFVLALTPGITRKRIRRSGWTRMGNESTQGMWLEKQLRSFFRSPRRRCPFKFGTLVPNKWLHKNYRTRWEALGDQRLPESVGLSNLQVRATRVACSRTPASFATASKSRPRSRTRRHFSPFAKSSGALTPISGVSSATSRSKTDGEKCPRSPPAHPCPMR